MKPVRVKIPGVKPLTGESDRSGWERKMHPRCYNEGNCITHSLLSTARKHAANVLFQQSKGLCIKFLSNYKSKVRYEKSGDAKLDLCRIHLRTSQEQHLELLCRHLPTLPVQLNDQLLMHLLRSQECVSWFFDFPNLIKCLSKKLYSPDIFLKPQLTYRSITSSETEHKQHSN